MIPIQLIRSHPEEVIERLRIKKFDAAGLVKGMIAADAEKRATQKKLDDCLAESNRLAREIGDMFKSGRQEEAAALKARTAALKADTKLFEDEMRALEEEIARLHVQLPNLPHPSVKAGNSSEDNEIVYSEGEIPALPADALPHWELARKYDLIDFDLGSKITGAGFPVYKKQGARLQRALINFFLDKAMEAGYTEIQPPYLVNEASGYGTGQLPDKDGQMYVDDTDKLYLIPTAEVPVTNLYRDVILKQSELPVRNVAYSACFRREAGSYGKDVRGLNRLHQFDKVEIVQIQLPGESYNTLEDMKDYVASLLRLLKLPFRILKLCGADISFTSALTYDLEVYSQAQQKWLEVSSVSNFEAFQANRMKLRYKDEEGKIQLAHTLNGSALALPRIVAALLENNQTPSGILIPPALLPYTGFDIIAR